MKKDVRGSRLLQPRPSSTFLPSSDRKELGKVGVWRSTQSPFSEGPAARVLMTNSLRRESPFPVSPGFIPKYPGIRWEMRKSLTSLADDRTPASRSWTVEWSCCLCEGPSHSCCRRTLFLHWHLASFCFFFYSSSLALLTPTGEGPKFCLFTATHHLVAGRTCVGCIV